jgi:integrase
MVLQGGLQKLVGESWLKQWGVAQGPATEPTLGATEREAVVRGVVERKVAEDSQSLREPVTLRNYQRAARAFQEFLSCWGKRWEQVTASDVLVYIEVWIPQNQMGEEEWVPSTLRGRVSDLRRVFELCGCSAAWNEQTQQGNPVHAHVVTESLERYARQARARGYAPRSAPPVARESVGVLTTAVARRSVEAINGGLARTALVQGRNRLLLVWQWASGRRGQDLLRLTWEQVRVGGQARLAAVAWEAGNAVTSLYVSPQQTKNSGTARPLTIQFNCEDDCEYCPVQALYVWWRQLKWAGEATSGPLFCSYRTTAVPEGGRVAMTSSAYSNQFKSLTRTQGVPTTQVHGMRRGRLQDEEMRLVAQGVGERDREAVLLGQAGMSTARVLSTYLDRGRHLAVYGDE